ncbi:MAG TPA: hypothetical protein VGQ12_18215 [Candidatus Angelobacter sp.]|nr:hypothetical protein [Candidatus Angelobacter sp.]
MAEFCTNCGAPLSGVFCGRCGHRAQSATAAQAPTPQPVAAPTAQPVAASQPLASPQSSFQQPASNQPPMVQQSPAQQSSAQQSPAQPPAAQPPKSSGGGKALLIVGGIVLIMVLGAFGAVLYGVHWVKHKVSSITGGSFGSEVGQGNMCKLLSPAELQQMIGVTVERSAEVTENGDPGCAYYTNSAAFAQLQKIAVEQARRDSEKVSNEPGANSKNDNPLELLKHTKEMEGIVKGLGLSQPDPNGRVFAFSVNRNFGSGNWWPLRTTLSAVPGFDEVNGVGDHAMIGSFGHAFYVLKGDSMFKLETMYLPEARVRGSEIAKKMISHL